MRNPFEAEALASELSQWVAKARQVEIHKAGNAQGLIDWYNNGADGQIQWGSEGDFDACVAIAGKYLDNPQGFCQLRHIDATGGPAGKAPGEIQKGDKPGHPFHGNQHVKVDEGGQPVAVKMTRVAPGYYTHNDLAGNTWRIEQVQGRDDRGYGNENGKWQATTTGGEHLLEAPADTLSEMRDALLEHNQRLAERTNDGS